MSSDERARAVAAVDAVLEAGKQLARDHQRRMPIPSYGSAP